MKNLRHIPDERPIGSISRGMVRSFGGGGQAGARAFLAALEVENGWEGVSGTGGARKFGTFVEETCDVRLTGEAAELCHEPEV
jgi:hypothetical protein